MGCQGVPRGVRVSRRGVLWGPKWFQVVLGVSNHLKNENKITGNFKNIFVNIFGFVKVKYIRKCMVLSILKNFRKSGKKIPGLLPTKMVDFGHLRKKTLEHLGTPWNPLEPLRTP